MIWQDLLFAGGGIIFALALIPAILHGDKPPLATSLTTGLLLAAFVVGYATLGLWLAAFTTAASSALWLTLAFQKVTQSEQ
jgi:hypothetical protein